MKKSYLFIVLMITLILPAKVLAITEAEIKENKKITVKSVPPKNEDEAWQLTETLYEETGFGLINCNDDFTTCTVVKGTDEIDELVASNVTVIYEYDADVKKVVDDILKGIPEGGKQFYIEDVHMLKWILDQTELDKVDEMNEGINPIKYSTEFNNFIGYNNFFFEPRMGDDTMYANFAEGTSQFKYDGVIYGYGHMATRVNHVLYVNDNETNIEGALKTRLSKYFNIDRIEKDTEVTISDLIDDYLEEFKDDYNNCVTYKQLQQDLALLTDQDEINAKEAEIQALGYYGPTDLDEEYESADAYALAMREELTNPDSIDAMWNIESKVLPNVYVVYFTDGGEELSSGIPVFVAKDSSKVFNEDLEVKTRDAKSGVTINTVGTSKKLPFDTLIKVSKLTSGTDYNKVVSALESLIDKDNIEMFDLKLFSNAIEDYITKLDDGSFKVRIPLNDKFKDSASLIAYYVDENNKVQEIAVTIEVIDNVKYASFTTDHFSIYTLAEKEEEGEPTFKLTYDFNGGSRQGEKEYVDESVGFGMDITKDNFIDKLGVTAPENKELDAIEINGKRTELGENYLLNKDTTFKYIWKDITNDEVNYEEVEEEKTTPTNKSGDNPQTNDNITTYVIMLILSMILMIVITIFNRKTLFKK